MDFPDLYLYTDDMPNPSKKRGLNLSSIAFIIGLIILALAFTVIGYYYIKNSDRSIGWPTAEGTVSHVDITSCYDYATHTSKSCYSPTVTYTVNRQTYSAKYDLSTSYDIHQPITKGTPMTVAYDPNNPTDGIIKPSGVLQRYGSVLLFVGIIGTLIAILVGFLRMIKQDQNKKQKKG